MTHNKLNREQEDDKKLIQLSVNVFIYIYMDTNDEQNIDIVKVHQLMSPGSPCELLLVLLSVSVPLSCV